MDATITISLDTAPLVTILKDIESLKRTPEVLQLALDIVERPSEFLCFKSGPASGTTVTTLLEPTDRLFDRFAAVRAVQV